MIVLLFLSVHIFFYLKWNIYTYFIFICNWLQVSHSPITIIINKIIFIDTLAYIRTSTGIREYPFTFKIKTTASHIHQQRPVVIPSEYTLSVCISLCKSSSKPLWTIELEERQLLAHHVHRRWRNVSIQSYHIHVSVKGIYTK